MEFNHTFINNVNSVFLLEDNRSSEDFVEELSLENNNMFNRFLVTKLDGDEIEIPMIAREHIESIITNNILHLELYNIRTVVLPLYENSIPQTRRASDSFIKQFFTNVDYNRRLQKIISSKGEVYYGGKGLIFDDKYNPLILCTLKARKEIHGDGETKMRYFKPVIYVNPIVFTESDRLINKGIIKKIIPCYTDIGIRFPMSRSCIFYNSSRDDQESRKAMVIIDNLNRFFIKPTIPEPQSCTNESLNECLVNNIDDILTML